MSHTRNGFVCNIMQPVIQTVHVSPLKYLWEGTRPKSHRTTGDQRQLCQLRRWNQPALNCITGWSSRQIQVVKRLHGLLCKLQRKHTWSSWRVAEMQLVIQQKLAKCWYHEPTIVVAHKSRISPGLNGVLSGCILLDVVGSNQPPLPFTKHNSLLIIVKHYNESLTANSTTLIIVKY